MFIRDPSFFRNSFFISSFRASTSTFLPLDLFSLIAIDRSWPFKEYFSTSRKIKLNSASDITPSFNAFETCLLTERCVASARETVFSCFVIFLLSLPLLTSWRLKPLPSDQRFPREERLRQHQFRSGKLRDRLMTTQPLRFRWKLQMHWRSIWLACIFC